MTFVCECDYMHVTSWVCLKKPRWRPLLCTCLCVPASMCTVVGQHRCVCTCAAPGPTLPQTQSPLQSSGQAGWALQDTIGQQIKAPDGGFGQIPVQRGSELTQATGSSPWHRSLAPCGRKQKDQHTGSLEEAPSICSSLHPECGLFEIPIWSSHSGAFLIPQGLPSTFRRKGPKP